MPKPLMKIILILKDIALPILIIGILVCAIASGDEVARAIGWLGLAMIGMHLMKDPQRGR